MEAMEECRLGIGKLILNIIHQRVASKLLMPLQDFRQLLMDKVLPCGDELVNEEIESGKLFYISDIMLPGFGYHLVYKNQNSLSIEEKNFCKWIKSELPKQTNSKTL